jgi:hypothetical protein
VTPSVLSLDLVLHHFSAIFNSNMGSDMNLVHHFLSTFTGGLYDMNMQLKYDLSNGPPSGRSEARVLHFNN